MFAYVHLVGKTLECRHGPAHLHLQRPSRGNFHYCGESRQLTFRVCVHYGRRAGVAAARWRLRARREASQHSELVKIRLGQGMFGERRRRRLMHCVGPGESCSARRRPAAAC